jgi:putative acetyltransferase
MTISPMRDADSMSLPASSALRIRLDDLQGPEIAALLAEHLRDMYATSPPESVHALDLAALRAPGISFWTIWDGKQLAGCGALKQLDAEHAEIKSMRTALGFLRRGVATQLLQFMLDEARRRGYRRLSLETGSMAYFAPARALYVKFGFIECEPFSDYQPDPNSTFMTRTL